LSQPEGKERRVHTRYVTELDIQGSPDEGGVVARMVARNLSVGGLYCTSTTDFAEMTRLAVRLQLPLKNGGDDIHTEAVDLEAVVVRRTESTRSNGTEKFDLALFFTNIETEQKAQIQRYLDQSESLPC
jgi:hypothetical protein